MGNCIGTPSPRDARGRGHAAVYLPPPPGGLCNAGKGKPLCTKCGAKPGHSGLFEHTNGSLYCTWCLRQAKQEKQDFDKVQARIAEVKKKLYPRKKCQSTLQRIDSGVMWDDSDAESAGAMSSPAESFKSE